MAIDAAPIVEFAPIVKWPETPLLPATITLSSKIELPAIPDWLTHDMRMQFIQADRLRTGTVTRRRFSAASALSLSVHS